MVDVERQDIRKLDLASVPSLHAIYPCNVAIGPFDDLYVVDKANGRILIFDLEQRLSGEIAVEGARGLIDVRVDSSGRIHVLDAVDGSVHLFDRSGRPLFKFGTKGLGQGQFRFPVSLAVDQKGLIYVADQHRQEVLVFNRRGEFLFDFSRLSQRDGRLHRPSYIYINQLENIFVIDHQNSRLSLFE
jgi:DNA-binding beta-propeller fold protein YncE